MPKSKTIEIDEIVTPDKPEGDNPSSHSRSGTASDSGTGGNPFAEFQKALPWKARMTLKLTQWFMLLRSKSWGRLILIPVLVIAIVLAILIGIIAIPLLLIRTFLKSFKR